MRLATVAHQIILGENFETRLVHFTTYGGIFVAQDVGDTFDREQIWKLLGAACS